MDITHITSHSIRRLLTLTEKKDELIKAISEIETQIASTLKGTAAPIIAAVVPPSPKPSKPVKAAKASRKTAKSRGGRPGGLKDRIIALLEGAGAPGLRVKEIADKLGAKGSNIAVWFSTTGKKHATRVAPGVYAAKGGATVVPAPKKAEAPAKISNPAKPAEPSKKVRRKLSPEARAKMGAAAKARWAARRALKSSAKPAASAKPVKASKKKGFKLSKKA